MLDAGYDPTPTAELCSATELGAVPVPTTLTARRSVLALTPMGPLLPPPVLDTVTVTLSPAFGLAGDCVSEMVSVHDDGEEPTPASLK